MFSNTDLLLRPKDILDSFMGDLLFLAVIPRIQHQVLLEGMGIVVINRRSVLFSFFQGSIAVQIGAGGRGALYQK